MNRLSRQCLQNGVDPDEFYTSSTDEGRDASEGEMAYKIVQRGGQFWVVEYLADEPEDCEFLEGHRSREAAERALREFLAVRATADA